MADSESRLLADFILALDEQRQNVRLEPAFAAITRYREAVERDLLGRVAQHVLDEMAIHGIGCACQGCTELFRLADWLKTQQAWRAQEEGR